MTPNPNSGTAEPNEPTRNSNAAMMSPPLRPKAVEKFKTKIRDLTRRSHNLDQKVVDKVNAVVRGTANYFATAFSSCDKLFGVLDKWLRMRIRSMKFKRKRTTDNWRLWRKHFHSMGLEFLSDALVHPAVEPT